MGYQDLTPTDTPIEQGGAIVYFSESYVHLEKASDLGPQSLYLTFAEMETLAKLWAEQQAKQKAGE